MASRVKAKAAFEAMSEMGIPQTKTKSILKRLLKLFDKSWDLIEAENYRLLADSIFEFEDAETAEKEKKKKPASTTPTNTDRREALEEQTQMQDEVERPLKRPRLKHQGQTTVSQGQPSPNAGTVALIIPKPEPEDFHGRGSQPISPNPTARNKGKQPISPQNMGVKESATSHGTQRDKRASQQLQIREPRVEQDAVLTGTNKQKHSNTMKLIMPKDEPFTDDVLLPEPLAVVLPGNTSSDSQDTNTENLLAVQKSPQQLNLDDIRCLYDMSDITRGEEQVKVSIENSNSEPLPLFHYITQNVVSHNARVRFSLSQIGEHGCCTCDGDCLSSSPPCNCAQGGRSPYTSDRLVNEEYLEECISMVQNPQKHSVMYCEECPLERLKNEDMLDPCKGHLKRNFIKECWMKCGCSKYCGNQVVQRGIRNNFQVFWTPEGKGWGLRALEDLPKGLFVCEYVGEILTCTELRERNMRRSSDNHSYSVVLDAEWASKDLKEEEVLCLDAMLYGNVSRFINHRCSDANLIAIPVEVETPMHHYYHVALFTARKVDAFEELTWDYGVDFDDNEHDIKAFRCLCGSKFCRNMKRSSRSRSALTLK